MASSTLWILVDTVLLLAISGIVRCLDVQCGDGDWVQGHRGCYYFEMELKPYSDAKVDCQNRGGLLLSIGSVAELSYIRKELKSRIKDMNHLKWWVGLETDPSQPGARYMWRWADGGDFNKRVSPWSPGEPNNADDTENCVELNYKGKLNDADCLDEHSFICEKLTGTTTSDVTTASQPETSPDKFSLKTSDIPVPDTTEQQPEETVHTSVHRRDTKGPAVRETTPNLPEAPSPETTPQPPPEPEPRDDTRASDTQTDFSTHVPTPEETTLKVMMTSKPVKQFCDPSNSDGLLWPETRTGSVAKVPCANGFATWQCDGLPARWRSRPEISDCASPIFKSVFKDVLKPQKMNEPVKKVSAKKVAKAVSSLATITKEETLTPQEVVMTSRALSTLAMKVDLKNSSTEEIKNVVSSVVETTSNLLSKNKTTAWSKLPKKDQRKSAASLLEGVEKSAMAVAEVINEVKVIRKKDENIDLQLVVLDPKLLEEPEVVYGADDNEDEFVLPSDMLKDDSGDDELTKIVFVTYHEIADLLQPEPEPAETPDSTDPAPQKLVVSNVISVSVHGKTFHHLKTPIKFTMKHTKTYPSNAVPSCVFWKFAKESDSTGSWSVEGCGVLKTNTSHTVCQCNHLTNFAVLMDVRKVEISVVHSMSLQLITYIGCIVSAICLVVSFFTFQFLKCLQGERNSIHKNLVFCLFVAELLFLFGIDKTYNKILCASMAGLMHYFFLASFTWMFLEGVHIVVMIVQVFDAAKSRLSWYYAAGYGIPLVIVGVSAGVNYKGYGTENYCWLSVEDLFIWSFAGPIAVILLVNATILTYAMSTVCKHSEYVIKEKNRSDSMRAWIQGALALEVLLGLTWVFGYFYINQETIVMAYIFTVLNSLQGLFIFCFHCLLNKKVRKEYKRVLDISRVTTSTNTKSATRSSLHRKQDPSYEMYVGSSQ